MPCFLLYMHMYMYVAKVLMKRGRPCNCSGISSKRGGKIPVIAYGITCTCSLPSVFDFFAFAFTYFYAAELVTGTCTMYMCMYMYHVHVRSSVDIFLV